MKHEPAYYASVQVHTIKVFIDDELYLFRFNEATSNKVLRMVGSFAADPDLNFTWHHAAAVCKAVRSSLWKASQHGNQPH